MSTQPPLSDPPDSNVVRLPTPEPRVIVAGPSHSLRARFERFVEDQYDAAFGARLSGHYPLIAGLVARDGTVLAAAGVRFAEAQPLFLERYLDEPVEQAIAGAFERPVARDGVVEIGSLASDSPAASLKLFGSLAAWLAGVCGRRFAVATARPELTKLLERAGFALRRLAPADPTRLGDEASDWGRYYERAPQVFAGEIGVSGALPLLRQRLNAKIHQREIRRLKRLAL